MKGSFHELNESDLHQHPNISKNKKSLGVQRELEAEIQAKNQEIDDLKILLEAKNTKIASQARTIKTLETDKNIPQVVDLAKELKAKKDEIEKLKGIILNKSNENERLKQNIRAEQEKVSKLKNENSLLIHSNDKQKEKLIEINKRNKILEHENQQKTSQINQLLKAVNNLSKKTDNDTENSPPKKSESKIILTCTICHKPINKTDLYFYGNDPYHKKCVKCGTCQKQEDDLIRINQTTFLCKEHFDEYKNNSNEMPQEIAEEYHKQVKKNMIELFDKPTFSDEGQLVQKEMIQDSFNIDQPYEYFVPSSQFHFDLNRKDLNIGKLTEIIGNDFVIIGIDKGSTLLKLAYIGMKENDSNIRKSFNNAFTALKKRITSPLNQTIVGNLMKEPEVTIPDENKIKELYNKPSLNILQNCDEINEIDIKTITKKVLLKLDEVKKNNWKYLTTNSDLFDQCEEKIKEDISNNPIEMIIIGQTVIANKYIDKYQKIKSKIKPKSCVRESFMYHGSLLENHIKIVKKHFLMPGEDKMESITDFGWFGQGIYTTDNLFYASMYGNNTHYLEKNEKTCVLVCRTIYNDSKVKDIIDLTFDGEPFSDVIKINYGVHHALVGNNTNFWPIEEKDIDKNFVVANEYVFPNKYQLFPILSITVMRTDHLVIWKDDHINNEENSNYTAEARKIEVNFYNIKTNDDALKLINLKKFNKIKLITNGGEGANGKDLINAARKILKSNFVCLVFAKDTKHLKWVTEMENVLFTTNPEDFKEFIKLKMIDNEVLEFVHQLEESYSVKFSINKKELLKFPLADKFDTKLNIKK